MASGERPIRLQLPLPQLPRGIWYAPGRLLSAANCAIPFIYKGVYGMMQWEKGKAGLAKAQRKPRAYMLPGNFRP